MILVTSLVGPHYTVRAIHRNIIKLYKMEGFLLKKPLQSHIKTSRINSSSSLSDMFFFNQLTIILHYIIFLHKTISPKAIQFLDDALGTDLM